MEHFKHYKHFTPFQNNSTNTTNRTKNFSLSNMCQRKEKTTGNFHVSKNRKNY